MNECKQRITDAMATVVDRYDEAYDKACEKAADALQQLGPAAEKAAESFRRAIEAAAKTIPGWSSDKDGWPFKPGEEILTRDEAFSGLHKRRKKGKVIRP